jgi:7-carboxy-7-deazaguanine synthase
MLYPVSEIFRSIQGEGHFVGYPMTFVRLAGCSVQECSIRAECDEAPWRAKWKFRVTDIVDSCKNKAGTGIVCITGGEPTDHELLPLIHGLRDAGYRIHMETSGVRSVAGYPLEWLTVSPKCSDYNQRSGHTLKLVVRPEWKEPWAHIRGYSSDAFFHYYLQPLYVDGQPANLQQVIDLVTSGDNGGGKWALSTQAHKGWNIP